jgi:hypothetical protein
MDLFKIIEELRGEKERVDRAIASVEKLTPDGDIPVRNRRGRNSMSPEERLEISARVKRYWENRRKQRGAWS